MRPLKRIGNWDIGNPLGKGGNGTVFEATRQSELGALKISNSKDPKRWQRFTDEIDAMKRSADIRGVLPILDAYNKHGERPWFVMGRAVAISTKLGTNPLLRTCVEAIRDVTSTLSLMHARGISHRDVKPDNLFYFDGHWAVGDFGLAHFDGKAYVTQSRERIGPVHYIAPEMLNEAAQSDGRAADVYSLAKTLWVLATGQTYPLPGEYTEIAPQFRISSYTTGSRTAALDTLIRACTQFDPRARPSMEEVFAELSAWLAPETLPRPPIPIRLDVGQFAAELERQRALLEASQKRSSQLTANREKHGKRIREALRPLASDVAETLREAGLQNVTVNIDNFHYGFELGAHVPRVPDSGVRLMLYVGISTEDQNVRVTCRFTAHPIRASSGLSMVIWDKDVTFLAEGSQEIMMLGVLDVAIREQLQLAVNVVVRLAFTDDPDPQPPLIPASVTVRTPDAALTDATVTLLLPNGLYMSCKTNPTGLATFNGVPATPNLKAFVAHAAYPGLVADSSPLHATISVSSRSGTSGSFVATSGWTAVPGFPGSLNFIHDAQDRRYVYAPNMTINEDTKQPVTVELGKTLSFADVHGQTVTLVPRAFHGACFLLDIQS